MPENPGEVAGVRMDRRAIAAVDRFIARLK